MMISGEGLQEQQEGPWDRQAEGRQGESAEMPQRKVEIEIIS